MKNFWQDMREKGPILVLAPMADVTDPAFRYLISKNSGIPHVTYTEFVSADGICLAPEVGRKKLMKDLEYTEIERPIVAQFFSSRPEMMEKACSLALELGFDGVDINMGCPDKSVEKQGAGAGLIKTPEIARELIKAANKGAQGQIPVSVKTRLGYNKDELEEWLPELLKEEPAVIIIHARTRKEMSKVPARWERVKRAVEIRDELQSQTLIMGNGDLLDVEDARNKALDVGADGSMLGRAIFGNPFLFSNKVPTSKEKVEALKEHIQLFEEKLGGVKSFAVMKKHFKSYLSGVDHELKNEMLATNNAGEAIEILQKFVLK